MGFFETEIMNRIGDMTSYSGPDWGFDLMGDLIFWRAKADELNSSANLLWSAFENDCYHIQILAKNIAHPG
jgi:hypothetical protein